MLGVPMVVKVVIQQEPQVEMKVMVWIQAMGRKPELS